MYILQTIFANLLNFQFIGTIHSQTIPEMDSRLNGIWQSVFFLSWKWIQENQQNRLAENRFRNEMKVYSIGMLEFGAQLY